MKVKINQSIRTGSSAGQRGKTVPRLCTTNRKRDSEKHVTFNENNFPLTTRTVAIGMDEILIRDIAPEAITPSVDMLHIGCKTKSFKKIINQIYQCSPDSKRQNIAEAEPVASRYLQPNPAKTGRRYPGRRRVKPKYFTLNALTRLHDEDDPNMTSSLSSPEKDKWLPVLNTEVSTLQQMHCYKEVEHPEKARVLH